MAFSATERTHRLTTDHQGPVYLQIQEMPWVPQLSGTRSWRAQNGPPLRWAADPQGPSRSEPLRSKPQRVKRRNSKLRDCEHTARRREPNCEAATLCDRRRAAQLRGF